MNNIKNKYHIALLTVFQDGIRHPEYVSLCDEESGFNGIKGEDRNGVTVLFSGTEAMLEPFMDKGLCLKRFKENIKLNGDFPVILSEGSEILFNSASIKVVAVGKSCHADCPLRISGNRCHLSREAVFAEVSKSGKVSIGENTLIVPFE